MSDASLMYWNAKLGKTQPRTLKLRWNITGAAAASLQNSGFPVLASFGALTQAQIDDHLGSENEVLEAAFDATAMGADVFGGVINMKGQAQKVLNMVARCYSGTAGATLVERSVGVDELTASTLATELALTANGNIAFRVDFGNTPDFDALTAGQIHIDIEWVSK